MSQATPLASRILSLKATGDGGFEGLVSDLLSELTGRRFYRFSSGLQAGKDSETGGSDWGATALQCKRYKKQPTSDDLVGDLARAITANSGMDLWIVGSVVDVQAQAGEELKKTADREGVGVILLGGARLEALARSYPKVSGSFGLDLSGQAGFDESRRLQLLRELKAEIDELPWVTRLADTARSYLLERMDGLSVELGRRIDLAKYVAREAEKCLDSWWASSATSTNPLALLGEEGMGKTTLVARWLTTVDLRIPVLWIAARDVGSAPDLESLLLTSLIKLEKAEDVHSSDDRTRRRMKRWMISPEVRFLILVDGLNEMSGDSATRLMEQFRIGRFAKRLGRSYRFVLTCRPQRWRELFGDDQSRFSVLSLGGYNESELKLALEGSGVKPRELMDDTRELLQRPLYCSAARKYIQRPPELRALTKDQLYWLGIKHRLTSGAGLAKGLSIENEREALDFFASLAEQYLAKSEDGRITVEAFSEAAKSFLSTSLSARDLMRELQSMKLAEAARNQVKLDPDHLVLGQGLFSLNRALDFVENGGELSQESLLERIESFLEPTVGYEARVLEAALLFTLSEEPSKELSGVRIAFLQAWTRVPNFNEASERAFIRFTSELLNEYLDFAEWLWKDWNSPTRFRSLLVKALVSVARSAPKLPEVLRERTARWLLLTHPPRDLARGLESQPVYPVSKSIIEEANKLGGFPELINSLGLATPESYSQSNLFFVALAIFSVKPEPILFRPFIRSRLGGQITGRSSDALYSWLVDLFLGEDFLKFLRTERTEESQSSLVAHSWRDFSQEGHEKLHTRERLLEHFAKLLHATSIDQLLRWLSGYQTLFLDPCARSELVKGGATPEALDKLCEAAIEKLDPEAGEGLWRTRSQTSVTLLEKHSRALLCAQVPSDWGRLMARHLETVAETPESGFFLHDLVLFAPIVQANSLERLLEHLLAFAAQREKLDGSFYAELQNLFCCLFFSTPQSEKLWDISRLAEMPLYSYVSTIVESVADPSFAQALIERLVHNHPRFPFEMGLLSSAMGAIPNEAEAIALEEWRGDSAESRAISALILSASDSNESFEALKEGWEWNEEQRSNGLIPVVYRFLRERDQFEDLALSQLLKLMPLDFVGVVLSQDRLADYASLLALCLARELKQPQPSTIQQTEVTLPSGSRSYGSIGKVIEESGTLDLRDLGHWKGSDKSEKADLQQFFSSKSQKEADKDLDKWLQEIREGTSSEPFRSWWQLPEALDRLVPEHLDALTGWADELIEANPKGQRILLARRSSFYWLLMSSLLRAGAGSSRGVELWRILDSASSGILLTYGRFRLPLTVKELFTSGCPRELLQLRESVILAVQDDRRLHHISLAAALGDQKWLEDWSEHQLEESLGYRRALGATLLGGLPFEEKRFNRLLEVRDQEKSLQVASIVEQACEAQRRDKFARYWLTKVRAAQDPAEATASAQLFLLCADSRAYIWEKECGLPIDSRANRYLDAALWEQFSNTVSNQQRRMLDTFLGYKRSNLKERVFPFLYTFEESSFG